MRPWTARRPASCRRQHARSGPWNLQVIGHHIRVLRAARFATRWSVPLGRIVGWLGRRPARGSAGDDPGGSSCCATQVRAEVGLVVAAVTAGRQRAAARNATVGRPLRGHARSGALFRMLTVSPTLARRARAPARRPASNSVPHKTHSDNVTFVRRRSAPTCVRTDSDSAPTSRSYALGIPTSRWVRSHSAPTSVGSESGRRNYGCTGPSRRGLLDRRATSSRSPAVSCKSRASTQSSPWSGRGHRRSRRVSRARPGSTQWHRRDQWNAVRRSAERVGQRQIRVELLGEIGRPAAPVVGSRLAARPRTPRQQPDCIGL